MAITKWTLDPAHSEVLFKVKHLMITNVTGKFEKFDITAETDGEDFTKAKVNFTAQAASINTNSEQRDNHLKSADFFETEKYSQLKFQSTKFNTGGSDGDLEMQGDLTIKDISKKIKLNVEFAGIQKDPYGNIKAGFTVTGKINRKDWGLNWNAALEAGGVLVSDEVRISCDIQLVKQ